MHNKDSQKKRGTVMKRFFKIIFVLAFVFSTIVFSIVAYADTKVENEYFVSDINKLKLNCKIPIKYSTDKINLKSVDASSTKKQCYEIEAKAFGVFPVKSTSVNITEEKLVDVLGTPFGIKLYTNGVLVISTNSFLSGNTECCPALEGGIKAGDYLISINSIKVLSNNDVEKIVLKNQGKPLNILFSRNGKKLWATVTPKISDKDDVYRLGVWVRDSSAGIGTLTFYDNESNTVAGLGHGLCDSDTTKLLSVGDGCIVPAEIVSVAKSTKSASGELCGRFLNGEYSNYIENSNCGIYGNSDNVYIKYKTLPLGNHAEIIQGKAEILTTIDGIKPQLYDCEIINIKHDSETKNLVIEITDNELLEKTGGIVQGMSGSPIIQNGKLIGAVTHVLVDDPTKGYGIFAENMLETAQSVAECNKLKDAS